MPIDRNAVFRYRSAVGMVTRPAPTLADAARPGLQDGAPWSGLLSLHLRFTGVTSESWGDASLVQVFGLRGAVHLVPRRDLGVFTLGLLPRDREQVDLLRRKAGAVHDLLSVEGPMPQTALVSALSEVENARDLRRISTAGGFLPVWDTTDTIIHADDGSDIDVDTARAELTRRFYRYLGPASADDLSWWLAVTKQEARYRTGEIEDDLIEVGTNRGPLLVTTDTADLFDSAPELPEVLMVPPEDPLITRPTTRPWLAADEAEWMWPKAPPPGAVLVGGDVVGTWRRRRSMVTVSLSKPTLPEHRRLIEEQATHLPLPYPEPPDVAFD